MKREVYESDITGKEISSKNAIEITVQESRTKVHVRKIEHVIHIDQRKLDVEYDPFNDNGYTAFLDPSGRVAMLKEDVDYGSLYHGIATRDRENQAIIRLVDKWAKRNI